MQASDRSKTTSTIHTKLEVCAGHRLALVELGALCCAQTEQGRCDSFSSMRIDISWKDHVWVPFLVEFDDPLVIIEGARPDKLKGHIIGPLDSSVPYSFQLRFHEDGTLYDGKMTGAMNKAGLADKVRCFELTKREY